MKVKGIHHISTIVKQAQENVDFYTSLLGLRMIKKAVNFDDANTYHFYYGNEKADAGTIITFFPWNNAAKEGVIGGGQVEITIYAIPRGSSEFWINRLKEFKVNHVKLNHFDDELIVFKDKHEVISAFIESDLGVDNKWEYNGVTKDVAIRGFYGTTILSTKPELTKDFFTRVLGIDLTNENDNFYRFTLSEDKKHIDLNKETFKKGVRSTGTVHHVAFHVGVDEIELWKEKLVKEGIYVSTTRDRNFFTAIYFKEPGGLIIELSAGEFKIEDGEFFDQVDKLYLPAHFEDMREQLENTLMPIFLKETKELKDYPYTNKVEYDLYMDHQKMLNRINELAKISKTRDLTKEETDERTVLRQRYTKNITRGLSQMVDTIHVENEDGEFNKLSKKGEAQ